MADKPVDQIKVDKTDKSEDQPQAEEQASGNEETIPEAPIETQSEPAESADQSTIDDSVIPSDSEESQDLKSTDSSATPQNDNNDESALPDQAVSEPETEPQAQAEQPEEAEATEEVAEPAETPAPETPKNDHPDAKWYVVHTYSGHENKVAATLKQRIESEKLENKIFEVLVPMQDKIEIRAGKKTEVKEKIFPGYILVKMILDDNTWLAVRTTQGVTSFVGMGNKPTPIPESEVQTIVRFTQIQQPTFKQIFVADDTVKIVDGPFSEFIGKVDSVDEEKGKVKVLVSIFGRETPVELDFLQVQKI